MCYEKFSNTLSDNVSNWFVLTATLMKVKRHQNRNVVFQALRFVDDDFSDSREEHVLLLVLGALDKFEDFVEEELGVADGDTSKSNSCSLSDLVVLMVE